MHGLRDREALSSLLIAPRQNVFGKELYPSLFAKAAVYAREIIMRHPFIDGNKRTGIIAAGVFLEDNGYEFVAKRGDIVRYALSIVNQKKSIEAIATWLKKHCKKRK